MIPSARRVHADRGTDARDRSRRGRRCSSSSPELNCEATDEQGEAPANADPLLTTTHKLLNRRNYSA